MRDAMELPFNPKATDEILLADGWHKLVPESIDIDEQWDGDQVHWSFDALEVTEDGVIGLAGPVSSILAVRYP